MTMLRPNRRELLSAAIAAGLLPLLPRAAAAELGDRAAERRSRSTRCARWRGGWRGRPTRRRRSATRRCSSRSTTTCTTRSATARTRRSGATCGRGQGAVLPPGPLLQAAGRDQRRRGRRGAGDPVLARPLRHAGGPSGAEADRGRLRRVPGDGPGRGERLAGGARRLLLPHLGLVRAVRAVGARAGDRLGRAGAGGVPAVHPLLARAGAGRRGRHLRAAREPARDRGLPDRTRRARRARGSSRTSTRCSSCAATSSGSGSRR